MKELRCTHSKGLNFAHQNAFKDKLAFIKRLIKVLFSCEIVLDTYVAAAAETDLSESHVRTKVSPMNLLQCMN